MRILRKRLMWLAITMGVVMVSGEIFARYYLGLGTPPLSITHPRIEYMFKPDQDVYRFGNHIIINQHGMRTAPFSVDKVDGESRVMVFGDSVLNGGNQTDHAALATSILQERLGEGNQKIVVGNISAGSWGPGNWLAYAKEYGFFGANTVVLFISSHDYADNPTFQPLNENTQPTNRPVFALLEGITRYLPRYLPQLATSEAPSEVDSFAETSNEQEVMRGLKDLRNFLELAKNNSTNVLVLQHWEKKEIEGGAAMSGNKEIRMLCESMGITPISLEPYIRRAIENGNNPYRDNIHLNQIGQQLIANAIFENLPKNVLYRTR